MKRYFAIMLVAVGAVTAVGQTADDARRSYEEFMRAAKGAFEDSRRSAGSRYEQHKRKAQKDYEDFRSEANRKLCRDDAEGMDRT